MSDQPPLVLTIAGSDSGGGAGMQADLKAISACGGYGVSVVTSITAQNTTGVSAAEVIDEALITAQFDAVYADLPPVAVKSGMLADVPRVACVAQALRRLGAPHYVLDPVMVATSGAQLLEADAVGAIRSEILPLAEVVTPNIYEAQIMAGCEIHSLDDARAAAEIILADGCQSVLIKGGRHAAMPATDLLLWAGGEQVLEAPFIETTSTHGTGCSYSAAIATQLALGHSLLDAVQRAKHYISQAIGAGFDYGAGAGPTDHFYFLRGDQAPAHWH